MRFQYGRLTRTSNTVYVVLGRVGLAAGIGRPGDWLWYETLSDGSKFYTLFGVNAHRDGSCLFVNFRTLFTNMTFSIRL